MRNTTRSFYGQQENEKILYVVKPHPITNTILLVKIYTIAVFVFIALFTIGKLIPPAQNIFSLVALLTSLFIAMIGSVFINKNKGKNVSYITDRRIVRFALTNFFATNIRTLSWDEVVKVKTYPPNFLLKQMAIGNVVIHARTTVKTTEEELQNSVTVDDIEMKNVYYYRDLGNYIDKILFTYKKRPKAVSEIKPFVTKPKGQRY